MRLLYSEKHICCFITSGGAVDEGAAGLWQPFHSKVHGGWQPGTQRADSIILHYFSLSFHSFFPFLFFLKGSRPCWDIKAVSNTRKGFSSPWGD